MSRQTSNIDGPHSGQSHRSPLTHFDGLNPPQRSHQGLQPQPLHPDTARLCSACQRAFSRDSVKVDDFRRRRRNRHHASLEHLARAVGDGCGFCRRFARHSAGASISTSLNSDIILHPRPEPVRLFFAGSEQHLGREWREGDLDDLVCFNLARRGPDDAVPARLDPCMDSEDTFRVMSKWLDYCVSKHDGCTRRTGNSTAWYPTRLVDVGPPGSSVWNVHIATQEPPPFLSRGYLTLSHRWGPSPFIQLTSDTLAEFQEPVPIEYLPRTFRDAVSLAHRFDIRYVWIDSLCILQDSREDWQREASTMQDVYSHSACNIIAAHSDGPQGGLFRERDPSVSEAFLVRSERRDIPSGDYTAWDGTAVLDDYSRAPLNKRGWVFQERLLPPRSLHFGKDQVFWKCSRLFACESLPDGIPRSQDESAEGPGRTLARLHRISKLGQSSTQDSEEAAEMWEDLVEEYSGCVLTYEEDKLVALAGIAKIFRQATGDRYLAGLWGSRLVWQLCWRLKGPAVQERRSAYRAPSWSWASVEGQVSFDAVVNSDEEIVDLARVVQSNVVPLSGDDTGQLIDGSVILEGKLYAVEILERAGAGVTIVVDGRTGRLDYDPFVFDRREEEEPHAGPLFLLPMLRSRERPVNAAGVEITGLALREASTADARAAADEHSYRRVGYFNFRPDDGKGSRLMFGPAGSESFADHERRDDVRSIEIM